MNTIHRYGIRILVWCRACKTYISDESLHDCRLSATETDRRKVERYDKEVELGLRPAHTTPEQSELDLEEQTRIRRNRQQRRWYHDGR